MLRVGAFSVNTRPSPKDLQRCVTPKYATRWRELGIQLDLTDDALSIIKEDNSHDVTRRCNVMLSEWLKVDTEASWQKLFTAIDTCTRSGEDCDQGD